MVFLFFLILIVISDKMDCGINSKWRLRDNFKIDMFSESKKKEEKVYFLSGILKVVKSSNIC